MFEWTVTVVSWGLAEPVGGSDSALRHGEGNMLPASWVMGNTEKQVIVDCGEIHGACRVPSVPELSAREKKKRGGEIKRLISREGKCIFIYLC